MAVGDAAQGSCTHFGRCGGCTALDQPIELQLATKHERVLERLGSRLDGVALGISEPPRAAPLHARNRVVLPVHPHPERGMVAGLYERGTHEVIELEECRTQHQALTRFGKIALRVARSTRLVPYDEARQAGQLRALVARVLPSSGELLVGMVTTDAAGVEHRKFAQRLQAECAKLRGARGRRLDVVGVVHNRNDRPGNVLLGETTTPLIGRSWQRDVVRFDGAPKDSLSFRVSFDSFYQLHRHADRLLYQPALAMVGDVRGQRIVDAYGGVGTFGIRLASLGARGIDIVEAHPAACRDAADNAQRNRVANTTRVHQQAFDAYEHGGEPIDWLVVDPPRAGLGTRGLAKVADLAPSHILHVACSLESLVRDLDGLREHGYRVTAAHCADLFPHTDHVELVVASSR